MFVNDLNLINKDNKIEKKKKNPLIKPIENISKVGGFYMLKDAHIVESKFDKYA